MGHVGARVRVVERWGKWREDGGAVVKPCVQICPSRYPDLVFDFRFHYPLLVGWVGVGAPADTGRVPRGMQCGGLVIV